MNTTPRLSIGLPVYNGGRYLAKALDSLLGQSYQDFEIIIADNASTDDTSELCRDYESRDQRIRYFRQPRNIGSSPNHNFVVEVARGGLFKWASYDDLYGRELLERCVEALDEHPEVVLAHSWTANIDESDTVFAAPEYALATDGATAPERFRSILFGSGGDDIYAVMRTSTLRRVLPQDSYHHAEHPIVAALSLHGPFHLVSDWLYFRRDHPQQAERACSTMRSRCANMDPRRARQAAAPGGPSLRGIPLGICDGYPWSPLDVGRTAEVLPDPHAMVRRTGNQPAHSSEDRHGGRSPRPAQRRDGRRGLQPLPPAELADLPQPAERGRQSLIEIDRAIAQPPVGLRILELVSARPRLCRTVFPHSRKRWLSVGKPQGARRSPRNDRWGPAPGQHVSSGADTDQGQSSPSAEKGATVGTTRAGSRHECRIGRDE